MKQKVLITIVSISLIASLGGLGIYGGFLYRAVTHLQINDFKIVHMDFALNDVTLTLNGIVISPTGLTVAVDGGTYNVTINGSYISSGIFGSFSATKKPSILSTSLKIIYSDITLELATILIDFGEKIGNLEVTITLTSVVWIGIRIPLDQKETQVITPADVGF